MRVTGESVSCKLRKFIELPLNRKLLFFEALFYQLITGLLLKFIPFKLIPRLFASPSSLTPLSSSLTPHASLLDAIRTATRHASRFSPWKNKCLVQSLAGRLMLRKRKIQSQISLGLTYGQDKKLIAHAWLKSDDFEVVEQNGDYKKLLLF